MTLREQIQQIHLAKFGKEFHDHRKGMIPPMVKDLAEKIFDELKLEDSMPDDNRPQYWFVDDSVEVRAIKQAWDLMKTIGIRQCTPAVK